MIERQDFICMNELNGSFEIQMSKRRIKMNNPIQVFLAIMQLAKLRMFEYYYDFMDKFIDRSDFEYLEMDTDSAYFAMSTNDGIESAINPHLREQYDEERHQWFPRTDIDDPACDKFTPGLFKYEWVGSTDETSMICLSSKNYICIGGNDSIKDKTKISAKGVQKKRNIELLTFDNFKHVLDNRTPFNATKSGFCINSKTQSMITYVQLKTGLNYYDDKHRVLDDGNHTEPLDL